jgi:catechol 2,3-dioxygenase-like lactoylglutathione lyase family enzyme
MTALPATVGAITLFVEDPQRSKVFYERVFGLSTVYEDDDAAAFKLENTIVNLLGQPAARELIAPGTVAGGDGGSSFQLTIWSTTRTPRVRSSRRAASAC